MQPAPDFLLDPSGFAWRASSTRLRELYKAPNNSFDFLAYLVRNLGFARLRYGRSSVRLGFRQGALAGETVSAVAHALIEAGCARHVLEPVGHEASSTILIDVEDAIACFMHLAAAPGVFGRPRYHVQPLSLQRLGNNRLLPLRQALHAWRDAGGRAGLDGGPRLANGRSLLARMGSGQALVERISRGYTAVDDLWLDAAVGRPVEAHPDPLYGAAVAASYQAVADCREPRLELVDAEIASSSGHPVRFRYERLLLPWWAADTIEKVVFVSSNSIVRTASSAASCHIRQLAGAKAL